MSKFIFLKSLPTILEPIKKLIDRKAQDIDWNENDSNSPSYIANRTHYKEIDTVIDLPETTIEFVEQNGIYFGVLEANMSLAEGDKRVVIWDGTHYECITTDFNGDLVLGNLSITVPVLPDTGEPFLIFVYPDGVLEIGTTDTSATHTINIYGEQTIIHKIPAEYLPETGVGKKGTGENAEIFNDYSRNEANGEFSHAEGYRTTAQGEASHAEGEGTHTIGDYSHAEGYSTLASGNASHAEGFQSEASGVSAHAEGSHTQATAEQSHAEGLYSVASGDSSHAEGNQTKAIGVNSHSEGQNTTAGGYQSHAEGKETFAIGESSHTEGKGTTTACRSQNVIGEYNIPEIDNYIIQEETIQSMQLPATGYGTKYSNIGTFSPITGLLEGQTGHQWVQYKTMQVGDTFQLDTNDETCYYKINSISTNNNVIYFNVTKYYTILNTYKNTGRGAYVHIIGNGWSNARRSNAHTVDWDGNAWYQGDVYVGGTSQDVGSKKLATEEFVNAAVANIEPPSVEGLATETYVNEQVAALVDSSPDTLNTLNELAAALGDDPNFATTVATQIGGKVDKTTTVNGKALSGNITLNASDVGALPNTTVIPSIEGLATEEYVNEAVAANKPDWNAVKGESGYIENRTHWVGENEEVLPMVELNTEGNFMYTSPLTIPIEVGQAYVVNWNGIDYKCTAKVLTAMGVSVIYLGNGASIDPSLGLPVTDEPFVIVENSSGIMGDEGTLAARPVDDSTSVNVSIHVDGKVYHTIDGNFLPEYIYGYDKAVLYPVTTLTFEEGLHDCGFYEPLPFSLIEGNTYTVVLNGESFETMAKSVTLDPDSGLKGMVLGDSSIMETGEPNGTYPFTFVELPVEVSAGIGAYATLICYDERLFEVSFGLYGNKIRKVPDEFLPEKTHWENKEDVELLAETTVLIADDGSYSPLMFNKKNQLIIGETYKVVFNNNEYLCEFKQTRESFAESFTAYLGNGTFVGDTSTNEPFGIYILSDEYAQAAGGINAMVVFNDGSTQGTIAIYEPAGKIHKLDAKFLPDGIATEAYVDEKIAGLEAPDVNGLATEEYVDTKVANLVDSSPDTLNTLNELAAALNDDPNFATTVANQIGSKVDKTTTVNGKALSSNITLSATDIGALPDTTVIPSIEGLATKTGVINNEYTTFRASSTDGITYTATIDGLTSLTSGTLLVMIPSTTSASKNNIKLNINSLGAKNIYRETSGSGSLAYGASADWLSAGIPYIILYKNSYWTVINLPKILASDLDGAVPITLGGTGAADAATARTNLGITPANIGAATTTDITNALSPYAKKTEVPSTEGLATEVYVDNSISEIPIIKQGNNAIHSIYALTDVNNYTPGNYSIALGKGSTSTGTSAVSLGDTTAANGQFSVAMGISTIADGLTSYAEGYRTQALKHYTHAEGYCTIANGVNSHVEGYYTIANGNYQHVQGKYNIEDPTHGKYAHIVGNGESETERSNAHTLDWSGLGWFAGGLKIGGTSQDDAAAVNVLTENDLVAITNNEIDAICGAIIYSATEVEL